MTERLPVLPVPPEAIRRALAALIDRPVRAATSTVPVLGGIIVLTADFPASHEHNKALLTRVGDPREVLAAVERVAADAGLDHVRIDVLPPAVPDALVGLATAAGYELGRELIMVLGPGAGLVTPPPQDVVRELPWPQVRDSVRANWGVDLPGRPPAVLDQLTDRRAATARAVEVRHLAATPEGTPVARADLYLSHDAEGVLAQVENVVTDPPARGRGLARAVVTAGVRLALDHGATCVFLVADADDWPREFYGRLGFVPVATTTVLTRASSRA